jgi:hypothetical protein
MPYDEAFTVSSAGAVIAHARSATDTLAVLFPNTAALKRRSSLVLTGKYRVGGSAFRLAAFASKRIPAC